MTTQSGNGRLSEREFVEKAVRNLRKPGKRAIHSVWSGFNDAFRMQFGRDPYETIAWLEREGVVKTTFGRKGPWIYLAEDYIEELSEKKERALEKRSKKALARILNGSE